MRLLYKPDWEQAQQHLLAWWSGDAFGRCALGVTAPRAEKPLGPPPPPPADPVQRWTDLDYLSAVKDYHHASTFYGGEAFPVWDAGTDVKATIAAFLGCPVGLEVESTWLEPILTTDDWDVTTLRPDRQNRWWQFHLAALRRGLQECAGRSIPSVGTFMGVGDTLAALRGSERLLVDVALEPERVRAAEQHLMDLWVQVHGRCYDILREAAGGSTCWFNLWSPGRFYAVQNDFSYMISARSFREIFLPAIERQTQYLDHSVYHVDGIGAFRHVPALLELPRLQAFQILPGDGKPSPLHYLDTLRLVQAAGRNLHIAIPPDEVETALELLSARGLYIHTHCETEEQARYLLKMAGKWSHD